MPKDLEKEQLELKSLRRRVKELESAETERKKAEEALQKSEERFQLAMRGANDGLWDWDLETDEVYYSPRWKSMVGYEEHEIGNSLSDWEKIAHPDDIEKTMESVNAYLEGKTKDYVAEFRMRHKDGHDVHIFSRGFALRDSNKKPIRFVGTHVDITERKQAEEEISKLNEELEQRVKERIADLEAANRELNDFAYIISHDLKAPLRGISQLSDWLLDDYPDALDDKGKELLNLMGGRVRRMHGFIDGILDYSRVGCVKEKKGPVDINGLIRGVIDSLNPPDDIRITVEDNLPEIECDGLRIAQVFQNLLDNAIGFMDKPKGNVKVECFDEDSHYKFAVSDNGPGIEERHYKKAFQMFQTLTPRDKRESTGVGLAIAKKIVETYKGEIWLESVIGKGSTFFFTLPKTNPYFLLEKRK